MADCTGKTARDKTGRNMRDLETDDGELPSLGGEAGGEGRLRDDWGVKAGMEVSVHAMRILWEEHSQ